MQIREHLGSYLFWRAAAYNGNSEGPLKFIQCLMRQTTAARGPDVMFCELQIIALSYTPRFEGSFRQNDAQGIAHTPYRQFHSGIITSYNIA